MPSSTLSKPPVLPAATRIVAGRYRLIRPLGRGFLGETFLAGAAAPLQADPSAGSRKPDIHVVLKLLHPERGDPISEATTRLLAGQVHPNLAQLIDSGTDGETGRKFLVLPWIEGADWVAAAQLAPTGEIPLLLAPVCRGLVHVHEHGMVHGRLHGGNCLVRRRSGDGEPAAVLLDFGLDPSTDPEGPRHDFTALGWMLIDALVPAPRLHGAGDVRAPKNGSLLSKLVREVVETASPVLAYVIRRCLEIDSGAPFQSAAEILDELNRRAGLDLSIQPPELRQSLVFEGPFVGRAAPMDRLKLRLEALVGGSLGVPISPMAILVGEGGVGKSRLMKEFLAHAAKKNLTIHSGACLQSFRHPYTPLEPVIRSLADSLQQRREREGHPQDALHPLLSKYGSELVKISPRLGAQHGLKASASLEPEHEKMRLIDQTCCFIHDASRSSPILLALEDVHCSDEGTLDLLRYLCRASRGGSVHILAAARREDVSESPLRRFVDEGSGEGWLEQISVERLSDEDLAKLASQLIPLEGPPRDDFYTRICAEASGNPHYLQEILRSLVEERVLSRSGRKWSFAPDRLGSVGIPHRLAEGFLDRVQRLEIPQVQLVRLLAAYGRPASVDQLSRMLDRPRWETLRQSEDLVDRAFLERLPVQTPTCYRLRYVQYGEALLGVCTVGEQISLHRTVITEMRSGTSSDDLPSRSHLARCLLASGQIEEASELGFEVGLELLKRNAVDEAIRLLQVLRIDASLSPQCCTKLSILLAKGHQQQGDQAKAREIYEQVLIVSNNAGLKDETAEILVGLARTCLWVPDSALRRRGVSFARQAYLMLCENDNPRLMKRLLSAWAGYFVDAGRYKIAYRLLEHAKRITVENDPESFDNAIIINQGITAALEGKLRTAESLLTHALRTAEANKDINLQVSALGNLVFVSHLVGDYTAARPLLARAQDAVERGAMQYAINVQLAMATNEARCGELVKAENMLLDLLNDSRIRLTQYLLNGCCSELGRVLLWLGRSDDIRNVMSHVVGSLEHEANFYTLNRKRLLEAWGLIGTGDQVGAINALKEYAAWAQATGNRRWEAEALMEMVLIEIIGGSDGSWNWFAERLTDLSKDGESCIERIATHVACARACVEDGRRETATALLVEAYHEAEKRGARIWSLVVANEQWRLLRISENVALREEYARIVRGRVEGILLTISSESLRRRFLASNLAIGYREMLDEGERNTAGVRRESAREQDPVLQSFALVHERGESVKSFVDKLKIKPLFIMIQSADGSKCEVITIAGVDSAGCELAVQAAAKLATDAMANRGVWSGASAPQWFPLRVSQKRSWHIAIAPNGNECVCLVYSYQHEPKPDEAAAAQLAAFLAAQLRSEDGERTEKVRGGVQIRAAIEKELPDDPLVVGRSPAIRRVLSKIHLASRGDVSVLIQGESGTGKELVAKRVHQLSARASRPFVAIDCGAIPENLVESELFGYRKAAFTGAERDKYGVFEDVNGGTLLLDEIGNASINFQAKLLRVLQEKEIRRIGETRARAVDVRVVAATNADLKTEAAAGRFREDLLYRISVVTIDVPPLRERLEDIPLLVTALIQRIQMKGTKVGSLTREVLHGLMHYTWPGNVRELGNALQAAALAADGAPILSEHLPESVFERGKQTTNSAPSSSPTGLPPETDADRERLLDALRQVGGDKSAACRILGWNRMKLYRRLKRYNLPLNLGKSEKA